MSQLFFYKNAFGIKLTMKGNISLNKETNQTNIYTYIQ